MTQEQRDRGAATSLPTRACASQGLGAHELEGGVRAGGPGRGAGPGRHRLHAMAGVVDVLVRAPGSCARSWQRRHDQVSVSKRSRQRQTRLRGLGRGPGGRAPRAPARLQCLLGCGVGTGGLGGALGSA